MTMAKWKCSVCGWIYDEQTGYPGRDIAPGTAWSDVPESFRCPKCGAMKKYFRQIG